VTISRPAPRRWPLAAAAALLGVLAGLLLGLALGGDEGTGPEEAFRDARSQLSQAAGLLEVVPVEYGQAVVRGEIVKAQEAEYRGARSAVERSRDLYREARPALAVVDAQEVSAIDAAYVRLARAMAARAPATAVERQAARLRALLDPA
jgi:hypothetical protein